MTEALPDAARLAAGPRPDPAPAWGPPLGVVLWLALVAFCVATAGAVDSAAGAAVAGFFLVHALVVRVAPFREQPLPARLAVSAAVLSCVVTLVPLPQALRAVLAPGPTAARADLAALGLQGSWAPISVDVGATAREGISWVAAAAALALLSRRTGPPRGAAVAVGALVVLHGLAWLDWAVGTRVFPLTPIEDPWGVGQERLRRSDFAGWLVNRNHWAALGVVLAPLALAWAWRGPSPARRALGTLAAALVAASVVATRSRAGVAVLALQGVAGTVVLLARSPRHRAIAALAAVLLVTLVGAGLLVAFGPRLAARVTADDVVGRVDLYAATARMALDSPLVGWGPGTFQAAFPAYQPDALLYKYSHAHSDPLEAVAGGGLLGLALVVGLAWTLVRGARARDASVAARVAWTLAVAGGAAAACVEFPLQVPAVRFLWLGVLFAGPARTRP